jgi:hypothetical protein
MLKSLPITVGHWDETFINDYHRGGLHDFSLFESMNRAHYSPLQTILLGPLSVSLVFAQILLAHSDIWEEYSIILTFLLFILLGLRAWPEALCENMENQYIVFWASPQERYACSINSMDHIKAPNWNASKSFPLRWVLSSYRAVLQALNYNEILQQELLVLDSSNHFIWMNLVRNVAENN